MFNDDYSIIFSHQELVERNECNTKSHITTNTYADTAKSQFKSDVSFRLCWRCSHWTWWRILLASVHPPLASVFVSGQSRQAFSSPSEPPSECFCWSLHPSPRDMSQHPFWLAWRSSIHLWQGITE